MGRKVLEALLSGQGPLTHVEECSYILNLVFKSYLEVTLNVKEEFVFKVDSLEHCALNLETHFLVFDGEVQILLDQLEQLLGGQGVHLLQALHVFLKQLEELPDLVQVVIVNCLQVLVGKDLRQLHVVHHSVRLVEKLLHVAMTLVDFLNQRVEHLDLTDHFLYFANRLLHQGEILCPVLIDQLENRLDLLIVFFMLY